MNRCGIIAGGTFSTLANIEECQYIIACDKGYEYCLKENIKPNLFVGDFDSYHGQVEDDIEKIVLPIRKDDTDTMRAFRIAVEKGFDEIFLYCGLGGRLDHTFANIQCGIFAANRNVDTTIIDEDNTIIITNKNEFRLVKKQGYSFSLFAADKVEGLYILNSKYQVENISLVNEYPLGQSNDWLDNDVIIKKDSGVLIVIESKTISE